MDTLRVREVEKYLGLPAIIGRLKKATFVCLKDNMEEVNWMERETVIEIR